MQSLLTHSTQLLIFLHFPSLTYLNSFLSQHFVSCLHSLLPSSIISYTLPTALTQCEISSFLISLSCSNAASFLNCLHSLLLGSIQHPHFIYNFSSMLSLLLPHLLPFPRQFLLLLPHSSSLVILLSTHHLKIPICAKLSFRTSTLFSQASPFPHTSAHFSSRYFRSLFFPHLHTFLPSLPHFPSRQIITYTSSAFLPLRQSSPPPHFQTLIPCTLSSSRPHSPSSLTACLG